MKAPLNLVTGLIWPLVKQAEVASWLRLADEAAAKLRAGQPATRPATRIITQAQMQPWARGVVWNCADPRDCRPVVRSDRDTVFRGESWQGRAVGTATNFFRDLRIATNVPGAAGQRAVETRVSEEVKRRVLDEGGR